jgi:competence protein ComEA
LYSGYGRRRPQWSMAQARKRSNRPPLPRRRRWTSTAPLWTELKALPGIGDANAKTIVAARPFKQKDELVKKGILPQPTYDKIKDQIVARQK